MAPTHRLATGFAASILVVLLGASHVLFGICGPFTDVAADAFCPFVLEIFYLGITTGTTPTTYDPAATVNRLQMAAFLSRTVDGTLKRGSRRAALNQYWTTGSAQSLGLTTVGTLPVSVVSDGLDLWVSNVTGTVSRVRAGDGRLLETWTGATGAFWTLAAMGRVFSTGQLTPGLLYRIDPSQPAGTVTTVSSTLGAKPVGMTFDGVRIWTADTGPPGSVSIITPGAAIPWTVTTVTTGFAAPVDALYDGANVWVVDQNASTLLKLSGNGAILQTVTLGGSPNHSVFDGANFWVPLFSGSVKVVKASNGAVLATLTGNGLNQCEAAAFDGQRVLVTNQTDTVSLWKAADLSALGTFGTGAGTLPLGACSDGANFWIPLFSSGHLARF